MRKLIMFNAVTLDGYFEGEKPRDLSFHELVWGGELVKFSDEQLASADMLVFGDKTYAFFAEYWPNAKDEPEEIADKMNGIPKVVCSTKRVQADWNNSTIVRDAVAEIPKLKQAGNGNIFVFGSGDLSESLMKADLFDEYRLCIVPVFLGKGRRLFNQGIPHKKLKYLEARELQTGGVILRYAATRD